MQSLLFMVGVAIDSNCKCLFSKGLCYSLRMELLARFIADEGHALPQSAKAMGKVGIALLIANEIRGVIVVAPIFAQFF